jgi:CheY-specific phosphatase CheX
MINPILSAALDRSVAEVLERMFFITAFDYDADVQSLEGAISARVVFRGAPSGSLLITVGRSVARSISADFLGEDENDLEDSQVGEVVCELANMVCGSVLSRVESTAVFHLESPVIVPTAVSDVVPDNAACHAVAFGGGQLIVVLETERALCPTNEKFVS